VFRKKPYDRRRHLDAADKARAKGRKGKAIAEYQKILDVTPDDDAVHLKIAPLLVAKGRLDEAWNSFQVAAKAQHDRGFVDRAVGIHRQAAGHFPRRREVWETLADLYLERERPAEAVKTLVEAEPNFRGRKHRDEALILLRRAVAIAPHHPEATMRLARTLAKVGEKDEAKAILEDLVGHIGGPARRRVRRLQFRLSPTPAALWRWIAGR
jgi:predicted Zn-dependent protease